ncbi:MAG: hypothetical protein Q8S02_13750 [Hydrogenophaga sp.]|nr:hypothetical protein [Hydrogenophaga sp.]
MPDWMNPEHWMAQVGLTHVAYVVNLAMALSALELIGRLAHGWRSGQVGASWGSALHVGAGLCLMLALREALTAQRPLWLLLWLSASGAAHLGDIAWRRLHKAQATPAHHIRPS